jgi:hypothetical protein
MDDKQNLRKIGLIVRVVGVLFAVMGGIGLVLSILNWSATSLLSLVLALALYLLMLVGGVLLFAFRHDGLEILFIILRLFILLGLGTVANGVLSRQLGTVVFGGSSIVIVVGLMIFLSQNNVKVLLEKKA